MGGLNGEKHRKPKTWHLIRGQEMIKLKFCGVFSTLNKRVICYKVMEDRSLQIHAGRICNIPLSYFGFLQKLTLRLGLKSKKFIWEVMEGPEMGVRK